MFIKLFSMIILCSIFSASAFATSDPTQPQPQDTPSTIQPQSNLSTPIEQSLPEKININTATTKELKQIPGITNNKAREIVKYRKRHGEFKSLEDLKHVNGFKRLPDEALKTMQDQMSVG